MNDDIRQALNEAARPGDVRPFRHTTYDAIARGQRYRRRRHALAAGGSTAVAAVTAGVLAFGFASFGDPTAGDSEPPVATGSDRPSGRTTTPLDLGPLSDEQAQRTLNTCTRGYGGADRYTILTARRVIGPTGPANALVAENPGTGDVLRCEAGNSAASLTGPSAGDEIEPSADAQDPFRRTKLDDEGAFCSRDARTGTREYMFDFDWLRVADEVARVDTRVGTDDEPGVWRVAHAHGGYVYTGYWFRESFPSDATIRIELRAFDAAGDPLPDGAAGTGTVVETFPSAAEPDGHPTLC
jgi:hypothetical protein